MFSPSQATCDTLSFDTFNDTLATGFGADFAGTPFYPLSRMDERRLLESVISGKCDLSTPPKSWLVTRCVGIQKWATAGVPADGDQFCVTAEAHERIGSAVNNSTRKAQAAPALDPLPVREGIRISEAHQLWWKVDYHVDLSDDMLREAKHLSRNGRDHWDNPDNMCVMDDPQIHVCVPFCAAQKQKIIIEAALTQGKPQGVADSIEKSLNSTGWAITVLQVDFNNPAAHLNVTSFPDLNVWCSVYIGIDPRLGFPYLYEVQLAKVIQFQ
ncbi:hypothetical protein OSTOST_15376 [Ostertagia ostertagi]